MCSASRSPPSAQSAESALSAEDAQPWIDFVRQAVNFTHSLSGDECAALCKSKGLRHDDIPDDILQTVGVSAETRAYYEVRLDDDYHINRVRFLARVCPLDYEDSDAL